MMKFILSLITVFFAPLAIAQTPPPCTDEIYQHFDFWIGTWDVFQPDGTKAGTNDIRREEYGCLLVERWADINGITGQSYNFVDAATLSGTPKWRQVWVSGGATIDYSGGLDENGSMILNGTIGYRNGNTAPFRGSWTLQQDGSVKQLIE